MSTLRRALGPFLTTGVALVAAAVVVANPIVTPPRDVAVPAVQLSAGADAPRSMFDKSLVDAIAVETPESTGPVAVLRQLFAALAADAGLLGDNAVSQVYPDDPSELSPTDPTVPSAPDTATASMSPADLDALAAFIQPVLAGPVATAGQIVPELQKALTAVGADISYVGRQIVVAAITAAGLVGTEPALVGEALTALANGDVTSAARKAAQAVAAPLRPQSIVIDALRTVAGNHGVGALTLSADVAETPAAPATTATGSPRRISRTTLGSNGSAVAAGHAAPPAAQASANGGTDLTDGNKVSPGRVGGNSRRPRTKFADGEHIRSEVADFGTSVRKLAGVRPGDCRRCTKPRR